MMFKKFFDISKLINMKSNAERELKIKEFQVLWVTF